MMPMMSSRAARTLIRAFVVMFKESGEFCVAGFGVIEVVGVVVDPE
jgi:hypothetical protein